MTASSIRQRPSAAAAGFALAAIVITTSAALADWNNGGSNAGRNGRTSAVGPATAAERWSGGASSIIA